VPHSGPGLYAVAKTAYIGVMAILKIARMGHPVLCRPAVPVDDPTAPAIGKLVSDMIETLRDGGGIGLAAPQVHVPLRVVIYEVPAERSGGEAVPQTVLVNPVVEPIGDVKETDWEGCLSVPGMMGAVPRFQHVRLRAFGLDGRPFERVARGYHARVVQHECDHLDGILYPMRIENMALFGYLEELQKAVAAAEIDEAAE
jgi:peptide deformylase